MCCAHSARSICGNFHFCLYLPTKLKIRARNIMHEYEKWIGNRLYWAFAHGKWVEKEVTRNKKYANKVAKVRLQEELHNIFWGKCVFFLFHAIVLVLCAEFLNSQVDDSLTVIGLFAILIATPPCNVFFPGKFFFFREKKQKIDISTNRFICGFEIDQSLIFFASVRHFCVATFFLSPFVSKLHNFRPHTHTRNSDS